MTMTDVEEDLDTEVEGDCCEIILYMNTLYQHTPSFSIDVEKQNVVTASIFIRFMGHPVFIYNIFYICI